MNTVPYSNARRAGRTHPEKREVRTREHSKFSVETAPGYRVLLNERVKPNRQYRRSSWGQRGGFVLPAAYRRVRSNRKVTRR